MKLISKEEAINLNLNKFFTGIKCNNGHISERYIKDGKCVSCVALRGKKYWKNRKKKEYFFIKSKMMDLN